MASSAAMSRASPTACSTPWPAPCGPRNSPARRASAVAEDAAGQSGAGHLDAGQGADALPGEFALIARHFRRLAGPGALDLADDAALLDPPPGRQLVLAADAMVEGVHFLPDDPPETIGRKLLRVNLSDLAAMGAAPLGYLMT